MTQYKKIEGYAPANTCRRCELMTNVPEKRHDLGCGIGNDRQWSEHFPYVLGCDRFSDWYANTAKLFAANVTAIAQEWDEDPQEVMQEILLGQARQGIES